MANQTNIFVSAQVFFRETSDLLNDLGMFFYLEKRIGTDWNIINIESSKDLLENLDDHYAGFFITSEVFDKNSYESIYDDEFCIHAIEGLGGRHNETELENLSLRIISKTPDKKIKSFINKLIKHLKGSNGYGMGVGPGTSFIYQKMFYNRDEIKDKKLWFDFKRKVVPATVDPI